MVMTQNIVSQLTPSGMGAIATLRLCGPASAALVKSHFKSSRTPQIGLAVYGDLHDAGEIIDDVLLVQVGPQTYEVHVHGSPWLMERCLQLAERAGFIRQTITTPAAVFDSSNDIEREVLEALPHVQTREALDFLLAQPGAWRAMLARKDPIECHRALNDQTMHWLLHPPTLAIVGQPNAGKSTLANQLFAQKRSIEADLPGTTRDWVGERANLNGLTVTLIDTPGLRDTQDPIERQAIQRSQTVIRSADLILHVLDATNPANPPASSLPTDGARVIRLLNKTDLASAGADPVAMSIAARSGQGLDDLRKIVLSRLATHLTSGIRASAWTDRQRKVLGELTAFKPAVSTASVFYH